MKDPRSLLLAALVFLTHLLSTGAHLQSPDDELLFRQTESLAVRGSLSLRPLEYDDSQGTLLVPPGATFATVQGRGGRFYAQYLPFQSVLAVPLVWLGKATAPLFAESFAPTVSTPYGSTAEGLWVRAVVVALFNPLVAALTALLLARLATFLTGGDRRAGIVVAALFGFGTMMWPHSRTFFTEPLAGLLAVMAMDALLRWFALPLSEEFRGKRLKLVLVAGLALSAAIWTRMDSPFIAAGFGLAWVGVGEWKRRRESAWGHSAGSFPLVEYALLAGMLVVAFVGLQAYNVWRFGTPLMSAATGGYADQTEGVKFTTPLLVGLHGNLVSPGRGLLFFSPAVLLGIAGWMALPPGRRWIGSFLALAWLPFAIAMCKWQNWSGGWDWGPRHIAALHGPVLLGAVFWVARGWTPARRIAFGCLMAVSISVQLYANTQAPMRYYRALFITREAGDYRAWSTQYNPMQVAGIAEELGWEYEPGKTETRLALALPAPLTNSVTTWEHSAWAGYTALWANGETDWWLLRIIAGKPLVVESAE